MSSLNKFREEVAVWERNAKACWLLRCRPKDSLILSDFDAPTRDKGVWLASLHEFEFTSDVSRQLSIAFHYLESSRLDYFLPCFLRGNLLDVVASDVSPRLAANYICCSPVAELRNRFSLAELTILLDYFDLIAVARNWQLEIEILAKQKVVAATATEE